MQKNLTENQISVLSAVRDHVLSTGKFPSLASTPVTRASIRHNFGNSANMYKAYCALYGEKPEISAKQAANWGEPGPETVRQKREKKKSSKVQLWEKEFGETHQEISEFTAEFPKGSKRYVITTALIGCPTNDAILGCLDQFAYAMSAEVIILPCAHPVGIRSPNGKGFLDKRLSKYHVLKKDTKINSNLLVSSVKLQPQVVDPAAGMTGVTDSGSVIAGHPQQRLKLRPTLGDFPHGYFTTGAITLPEYKVTRYESERRAYLARLNHQLGFLYVEVQDEKVFHVRHVELDESGTGYDAGFRWTAKGAERVAPFSITPGDLHAGETDPAVILALEDLVAHVGLPDHIIANDIFDCGFNNHHEKGKHLTRAERRNRSLANEVSDVRGLLFRLRNLCKVGVVVARSNHDIALDRYLDDGRYLTDSENYELGHKLVTMRLQGEGSNALEACLRVTGGYPAGTKFLREGEQFSYFGIELGQHFHRGPNGSRGSVKSLVKSLGRATGGHHHSPEKYLGLMICGVSTKCGVHDRPKYARGDPSSWLPAFGVTYPGGFRQLHLVIGGKWRS